MVGTPAYMSPEQAQAAEDLDIRSDIFALGATGFRLLTGLDPFPGTRVSSVLRKVRGEADAGLTGPLQQSDADGALAAIIRRCMQRERGERYQHAVELVAALEALQQPRRPERLLLPPVAAREPTPPTRTGLRRLVRQARVSARRNRERRLLLLLAAGMTVLLVAWVVLCRR